MHTALAQEDAACTGNYAKIICGTSSSCVSMPTSGSWNIDLNGCAASVEVYVAANTNIPRIQFSHLPSHGNRIRLSLGVPFSNSFSTPASYAGLDWGGLDYVGTLFADVDIYGGINGSLTGSARFGEVYRFDIGGAIDAPITIDGDASTGPNIATINAESITANGQIRNTGTGRLRQITVAHDVAGADHSSNTNLGGIFNNGGSIGDVTIGGDLKSFVQARKSTINSIQVGGVIDVINGPNDAILEPISARSIEFVTAQSIYAEINAADTFNGGTPTGHVTLIKTTNGGVMGDLRFRSLSNTSGAPESGIKIAGDAIKDGRTFNGVDVGVITIDSGGTVNLPITIGGSLKGDILCYGGTGTLSNQIVINGANQSTGTWATTGTLATSLLTIGSDPTVFAQPYLGPYYDATDSQLGGGAVGLVPFHLHDNDCVPVNGGSSAPIVTGSFVKLRFYGPVECPTCTSTLAPVRVEYYQTDYSPFSWVDVTSHYNFTYANNNRDLIVTAKDNLFGGDDVSVSMRVTPMSRLICKKSVLTTTSDVPVSSFTYSVAQ